MVEDYFQMNCCIVEMVTGMDAEQTYKEFQDFSSDISQINLFRQAEYWAEITEELKEVVTLIFALLPEDMIKLEDIDNHVIFKKLDN